MPRPVVDPQFGRLLLELREARGMSLRDLAKAALSSKTQIHEYETGRRLPPLDTVERLDRVLGADGRLIKMVTVEPEIPTQLPEVGVPRRAVVGSMTALAAGAAMSDVALEALRQGLRNAAAPDRDHWQAVAEEYVASYYMTPPEVFLARLRVDVMVIQHQLVACPGDRDLLRAAAHLSLLLAITLNGVGRTWTARRWWDTATELADQSGDLNLRITCRSQEAIKGMYDGRPIEAVLAVAAETLEIAEGRPCAGTAGASAARAQAYAITGQVREAEVALRQVRELTEAMPAAVLADETVLGWPEHRLLHCESYVHTEAGRTKLAFAAQDRALELYPAAQSGNRAMVRMHRAACLIQDGHIADGLRYAADTLDDLPTERQNQLVYGLARRTLTMVPQRERRGGGFSDFQDRVVDLGQRLGAGL